MQARDKIRIVHYLNQFFAGLGGEEAANRAVEVRREPVGATRGLIAELGDRASVVATIVGGDNYMNDERDAGRAAIDAALRETRGNRRKAAETLGIGERTLYRKLKEYALD